MRTSLLELIECPLCHGELTLVAATMDGDRVQEGSLSCAQRHRFPIREYLPIFAQSEEYVDAFSALRRPGRDVPELRSRGAELDVRALTRDEFWRQTQLRPEELRGRTVLDAGCGGGRFVELLAAHGVRVVGMDIDLAGLRQARLALGDDPNIELVQANLYRLPFRPGAFDFILSVGVLHHAPDPRAAFLELVPRIKKGGRIAIWVYPSSIRTPLSDLLRPFTTRIPPRALLWLGWVVTASYGPLLKVPRLKGKLQSLLYRARLPWHDDLQWRVHSFVDWYGPPYQFKYSPDEVERWFADAGLVEIVRCPYETAARGTSA